MKNGHRNPHAASPTPIASSVYDRMVDDAIELIEYLQQHLSVERVVLVGHSWGSFLGLGVIKKRPDLVSAFVGVGQVMAWNAGFDETTRLLIEAAEAAGDTEIAEELRALPDEWPLKGETQAFFQRIGTIQALRESHSEKNLATRSMFIVTRCI